MKTELATKTMLPLIDERDLEQMRHDNRRLVAENALLKQRIEALEHHIVTHAWAELILH